MPSERINLERVFIPAHEQQNAIAAAADPQCIRELMARQYADCIRADGGRGLVDFKAINQAILARWPKGLEWIKRRAWKLVMGR